MECYTNGNNEIPYYKEFFEHPEIKPEGTFSKQAYQLRQEGALLPGAMPLKGADVSVTTGESPIPVLGAEGLSSVDISGAIMSFKEGALKKTRWRLM